LNIGVIAALKTETAATVNDSIECFSKYGNHNYFLVTLSAGEIYQDIKNFDALIIHYSCIAYPYRYHLPISAVSSLKIKDFKGVKIAMVQDEQRSVHERLRFLNEIEITHLFSAANEDLHEAFYPSKIRNFTVSTVLTGYVSEKHIELSKRNILLVDRELDLVYRGRILPMWMGEGPELKGRIQEVVTANPKMHKYNISVSSLEKSRVYGNDWFKLLLQAKVSIITPSGSDYIDFDGKFVESWVETKFVDLDLCREPVKLKYQVISPRYFDNVAAGNYLAITPGEHSQIPIDGTYSQVGNDLEELPDIIEFSKTREGQKRVDLSKAKILGNDQYHYRSFVALVEEKISYLLGDNSTEFISQEKKSMQFLSGSRLNKKFIQFVKSWLPKKIQLNIKNRIAKMRFYFILMKKIKIKKEFKSLLRTDKFRWYMLINIRLIKEYLHVKHMFGDLNNSRDFAEHLIKRKGKNLTPRLTQAKRYAPEVQNDEFYFDFSSIGKINLDTTLPELSILANNDEKSLLKIINDIVENK